MEQEQELARLRAQLARAEGKSEALELELERAHQALDGWEIPRVLPGEGEEGRPLELSLPGRLQLIEESWESED